VGFQVDKLTLKQVYSEYFSFPSQFTFHILSDNKNHNNNSIIYNLCAEPTATKPITDTAQCRYNNNNNNNNNRGWYSKSKMTGI
jgi:hypothetical protein